MEDQSNHTIYKYRHHKVLIFLLVTVVAISSCGIHRHATLPLVSNHSFVREFERPSRAQVDSLREIYGNNKVFVEELIAPALIALSYYPDLKDIKIEFKYSKEATTMAARPVPLSLFSKRKYVVFINNDENFKGIHLKDVPFNAQIGIIGHELAHIVDYNNHNFWGIMGICFRHLDGKRKPLFEKEIDRATIVRGLGWQLFDWASYSMLTNNNAVSDYIDFKRHTYMQPGEIKQVMSFLSQYGHVTGTSGNPAMMHGFQQ